MSTYWDLSRQELGSVTQHSRTHGGCDRYGGTVHFLGFKWTGTYLWHKKKILFWVKQAERHKIQKHLFQWIAICQHWSTMSYPTSFFISYRPEKSLLYLVPFIWTTTWPKVLIVLYLHVHRNWLVMGQHKGQKKRQGREKSKGGPNGAVSFIKNDRY